MTDVRAVYSQEALTRALEYHKHGWILVKDNSPEAVIATAEKFLKFLSGK